MIMIIIDMKNNKQIIHSNAIDPVQRNSYVLINKHTVLLF